MSDQQQVVKRALALVEALIKERKTLLDFCREVQQTSTSENLRTKAAIFLAKHEGK